MFKLTSVSPCPFYSNLYTMYKFNYGIPGVEESGFGLIKPMLIKNVDNLGVHE